MDSIEYGVHRAQAFAEDGVEAYAGARREHGRSITLRKVWCKRIHDAVRRHTPNWWPGESVPQCCLVLEFDLSGFFSPSARAAFQSSSFPNCTALSMPRFSSSMASTVRR